MLKKAFRKVNKLHKNGAEKPNPQPRFLPVEGMRPAKTIQQQIQEAIRSERMLQSFKGAESFAEADDFEVGDDYIPDFPMEEHFDPVLDNAPAMGGFIEEKPNMPSKARTPQEKDKGKKGQVVENKEE